MMFSRFFKKTAPDCQPLLSLSQQKYSGENKEGFDKKEQVFKYQDNLGRLVRELSIESLVFFLYDHEIALFCRTNHYLYKQCSNFFDRDSNKHVQKVSKERRPTEYTRVLMLGSTESFKKLGYYDENTLYLIPSGRNNPNQGIIVYWWEKKFVERHTCVLMLESSESPSTDKGIVSLIPDEKRGMLAYWYEDNQSTLPAPHSVNQENISILKKIFGFLGRIDNNHNRFQEVMSLCTVGSRGLFREKTIRSQEINNFRLSDFSGSGEELIIVNRSDNKKLVDQIAMKCDSSKLKTWKKSGQRSDLQRLLKQESYSFKEIAACCLPVSIFFFLAFLAIGYASSYVYMPDDKKNLFLKISIPFLCGVVCLPPCGAMLSLFRHESRSEASMKKNAKGFYNRMELRFSESKTTQEKKQVKTEMKLESDDVNDQEPGLSLDIFRQ